MLREAAAAGAEFVRCAESVGELSGYDFIPEGAPSAVEGSGYYRRADAPPPDEREYSRMVLQRASAAGADFVACAEQVMQLAGYEHRDGAEGVGYYRLGVAAAPAARTEASEPSSFSDFMSSMRELGAM